jgi:hypothetical protein
MSLAKSSFFKNIGITISPIITSSIY